MHRMIMQNIFIVLLMMVYNIAAMKVGISADLEHELVMELMKKNASPVKVKAFLDKKISVNKQYPPSNDSLLHYAGFHDENFPCVQALLDYGAQVNAQNHMGETPLHEAIMFMNKNIIRILVANAADVNVQTKCKKTPMHYLFYFHKKHNDFQEMKELLMSRGVDLRLCDDNGNTISDLLNKK